MRICWWLVERLSQLLDRDEREIVLGDLAESGAGGAAALFDVLDLAIRRQASRWKSWRPWLTLAGIVVPAAFVLAMASRRVADHSAIYLWLYAENWDWTLAGSGAFRHQLAAVCSELGAACLQLAAWSWVSGFTIGLFSRGAARGNLAMFAVLLVLSPHTAKTARDFHNNAAVFASGFYRLLFPLVVQFVMVLLPAIWGMRLNREEGV
jgi:hypothetical protein